MHHFALVGDNSEIIGGGEALTLTGLEGHICPSLVKGLEGHICPCVVI